MVAMVTKNYQDWLPKNIRNGCYGYRKLPGLVNKNDQEWLLWLPKITRTGYQKLSGMVAMVTKSYQEWLSWLPKITPAKCIYSSTINTARLEKLQRSGSCSRDWRHHRGQIEGLPQTYHEIMITRGLRGGLNLAALFMPRSTCLSVSRGKFFFPVWWKVKICRRSKWRFEA